MTCTIGIGELYFTPGTNSSSLLVSITIINLQESDKLSDEDLYRSLAEMKKSLTAFSRKTKCIPGSLTVDISAPNDNMSCCLTSSLWEIDPFPDKRTKRPTREIEEFPQREVYSPCTTYK